MISPPRVVRSVLPFFCAALVVFGCLVAPLRAVGADTTPGRLGAIALVCRHTLDLRTIDWIAATRRDALPYWLVEGREGRIVSVFGAVPALIGAPAFLSLPTDKVLWDRHLMKRARWSAAASLGLCTALLAWAIRRARPYDGWAGSGALVTAFSFAGAATLGQGLWQQTASLPFVVGSLLALTASNRSRVALHLAPALLLVATCIRPALASLALGMGLAWLALLAKAPYKVWTFSISALLAVALAVPVLLGNLHLTGHMLPLSQYVPADPIFQTGPVFSVGPARTIPALAGLLLSPARGVVWFAPIVPVGAFLVWWEQRRDLVRRLLAVAIGLQFALVTTYCSWWGGWAFGPRFVAESVWVAGFLVATSEPRRPWPVTVAAAMTLFVGLVGLVRYDGGWDFRHNPDRNQSMLWSVRSGPLVELFTEVPVRLRDAPPGPFAFCHGNETIIGVKPVR